MRHGWGMLGFSMIAVALSVTGLSGCAASKPPIFLPDGTSICGDSATSRSGSFGVPVVNTGSTPITLTDAGALAVTEATVIGTWIAPPTNASIDDPVFSDEAEPASGFADWGARVAPAGAVIEPGATAYLIIVLGLRDGVDAGWIEGVQVATGDGVVSAPATGFGLSPGGVSCPWSPPGGTPEPSPTDAP